MSKRGSGSSIATLKGTAFAIESAKEVRKTFNDAFDDLVGQARSMDISKPLNGKTITKEMVEEKIASIERVRKVLNSETNANQVAILVDPYTSKQWKKESVPKYQKTNYALAEVLNAVNIAEQNKKGKNIGITDLQKKIAKAWTNEK